MTFVLQCCGGGCRLPRDEEGELRHAGGTIRACWDSRGHFFAAAAEAIRRILVESARRKQRLRHGGGAERIDIEVAELPTEMKSDDFIALDEALQLLEKEDPIKARLVTLRFFGGLTIEQAAETLGIARGTAHRYWAYARAWLFARMTGEK
jgi:RNA polymerase sigma factor (TIGR02999 family)